MWINLSAYTCLVCVYTHSTFSFQKPVQVISEHVSASNTNILCYQLNIFWTYTWLYWNLNCNLKRNILIFHSLSFCDMTMHRKFSFTVELGKENNLHFITILNLVKYKIVTCIHALLTGSNCECIRSTKRKHKLLYP